MPTPLSAVATILFGVVVIHSPLFRENLIGLFSYYLRHNVEISGSY
jgi:hypothetical protein